LQATLAQQRTAVVLREQGVLFAWARVRADAHHELAALAKQPWFAGLRRVSAAGLTDRASASPDSPDLPDWMLRRAHPPEGQGLELRAQLREGRQLRLRLRPAAWPMVQVESPSGSAGDSALFRAVLAGLAAEGRLAEVVVACAQRFGLTLAAHRGSPQRIGDLTNRHYFLQRVAWLMAETAQDAPQAAESEAAIRQLGQLQRRLFVLDEQRRRLRSQYDDESQIQLYKQEYEALRSLALVRSVRVHGDQVKLTTDTIYVRGVCVGSFTVSYDFAARRVRFVNTTRPVHEGQVRFDHPHVRNGRPCLGNIARAFTDLLVRRDLPKLIPLTVDFLRSYNPSGSYCRVERWS
jgi:hypothetical protein